jgi:head-tail adaptor
MKLNPGTMRDRIKLQAKGSTDPRTGPTWTDIATIWCQFRPASGREYREGSVKIGESRAVFTTQYRSDLHLVDRLIHLGRGGNRVWDISEISPVGFKDATDIKAFATDVNDN